MTTVATLTELVILTVNNPWVAGSLACVVATMLTVAVLSITTAAVGVEVHPEALVTVKV